MKIVIGSRESNLAVIQSKIVIDAIKKYNPKLDVELVTMKTTGDRILDRTLDKIGGKGLFIKELEIALMEKRVDLTVHSMKDMTMDISPNLPIIAVSEREDPRDALVLPKGKDEIDFSKPIGCSSERRILQFKQLYPEAVFKPIRGNVQTRLRKLDSGEYGATLFAVAGLKRAGLAHRISRIFTTEEILPAACQGILAVQGRAGEPKEFLSKFNDERVWIIQKAERSFVKTLDGGCSSPVAAYAEFCNEGIKITGLNIDKEGNPFRKEIVGREEDAEKLGRELALSMII